MIEQHEWKKGDRVRIDDKFYRLERRAELNGKDTWYGWDEKTSNLVPIENFVFVEHIGAWVK